MTLNVLVLCLQTSINSVEAQSYSGGPEGHTGDGSTNPLLPTPTPTAIPTPTPFCDLVAVNFERFGQYHYDNTPIPGSHNESEYVAAVRALASANSGQFSCLNPLLDMVDNDWWSRNNSIRPYSFAWQQFLLYAILGNYGFLNAEVWAEMDGLIQRRELPPASIPLWSNVNHTDPTNSKVKCDVMAGGEYQRGIYGQTQADYGGLRVHKLNDMCLTGTVYLRQSASGICTAVDPSTDVTGRVCGSAKLNYSEITPLSLLWDPELTVKEFGKSVSIVKFPLDLGAAEGTSYEWKATSKAPLLVYDPEHKGEITSATQLFGWWTFGGNGSRGGAKSAWRDAYEALGTLDTDKDGVVKGAELAPLGLWFDADGDAVSQASEVVNVLEAGLIALHYKDPAIRQGTQDKFLEHGFVRKDKDSQEVVGASVDWMARGLDSPQNLAHGERIQRATQRAAQIDARSLHSPVARRLVEFGNVTDSKFSGKWFWVKSFNQPDAASGFFAMSTDEQGRLLGTGVSELKVNGVQSQRYALNFVTMMGKIDPTNNSKITFELVLPNDKERATSSATLVERDGQTYLQGETDIQTTLEDGSKKNVAYRWWARKD